MCDILSNIIHIYIYSSFNMAERALRLNRNNNPLAKRFSKTENVKVWWKSYQQFLFAMYRLTVTGSLSYGRKLKNMTILLESISYTECDKYVYHVCVFRCDWVMTEGYIFWHSAISWTHLKVWKHFLLYEATHTNGLYY